VISIMIYRGGMGIIEDNIGGNGTLTGKACPEGLYGLFCEVLINFFMCYCFSALKHVWMD
jgi:hypothetical protein